MSDKNRPYGIIGCDHMTLRPSTIEHGRSQFARLGFTVDYTLEQTMAGVPGLNVSAMPFTNALIRCPLRNGEITYFELMAVTNRAGLPIDMRYLGDSEGLKSLVFRVSDENQFVDQMISDGYPTHDSFSRAGRNKFSTEIQNAVGKIEFFEEFARNILSPAVPHAGVSPFMYNAYRIHMDLDAYKQMKFADAPNHANGAVHFSAAFGVSETPENDAAKMAELWGGEIGQNSEGVLTVSAGDQFELELYSYEQRSARFGRVEFFANEIAPSYYGFRVEVASLDRTNSVLRENGVISTMASSRTYVHPAESCGAVVEFVEAQ